MVEKHLLAKLVPVVLALYQLIQTTNFLTNNLKKLWTTKLLETEMELKNIHRYYLIHDRFAYFSYKMYIFLRMKEF